MAAENLTNPPLGPGDMVEETNFRHQRIKTKTAGGVHGFFGTLSVVGTVSLLRGASGFSWRVGLGIFMAVVFINPALRVIHMRHSSDQSKQLADDYCKAFLVASAVFVGLALLAGFASMSHHAKPIVSATCV